MEILNKIKLITKRNRERKSAKDAKPQLSNIVIKNPKYDSTPNSPVSIDTPSSTEFSNDTICSELYEHDFLEKIPKSITKHQLEEMGTCELVKLYGSTKGNVSKGDSNTKPESKSNPTPESFVTTIFPQSIPPVVKKSTRPFRILAIDGGGVRGILPATLLRQLEIEAGQPISQLFDLIAGTSTGAILGAMLALPKESESNEPKFSANDGIKLYLDKSPYIFKTTLLRRIRTLSGLANAQYSNANKRKVIEEYIGDMKITDLLVDILVPSFDIREGKPYFFKTSKAMQDSNCNFKVADVLDATSCAPTFFPPHKVVGYDAPEQYGYRSFVDGALTANSPALCALAEAYHNYDVDPDNTVLVSLGCGDGGVGVDHEQAKSWGGLNWAPFFPNVMLSSSVNTVHYQLGNVVPPNHYFRVQTEIPVAHSDIDNVSEANLKWLEDYGSKVALQCKDQLQELAKVLKNLAPKDGRRRSMRTESI